MMITLILTIKEKSSLIKAFAHGKLYGRVKDLNNEGLIDSFWITNNETIKIRESIVKAKPFSITHKSALQF